MFPGAFTTPDGLRLACYGQQPPMGSPRAHVIPVHGLGAPNRVASLAGVSPDAGRDSGLRMVRMDNSQAQVRFVAVKIGIVVQR
jgi:hypothetical protein